MTLVSPGVETKIIDESLFVPNASSLVPLFFIATRDGKTRTQTGACAGTNEHSVVRSITSLKQSIEFYGEPNFLTDGQGSQHHGDARNEYGLMALNQYLTVGSGAYTVRANVNLNDDLDDIRTQWDDRVELVGTALEQLIANYITNVNLSKGITADGASIFKSVSNLIAATGNQTEAEFSGVAPYGSFAGGADFEIGDVVIFDNGMQLAVNTVTAGAPTTFAITVPASTGTLPGTPAVVDIKNFAGQGVMTGGLTQPVVGTARTPLVLVLGTANVVEFIQTDVDFAAMFTGGTNYSAGDVITLSNGSIVTVMTVGVGGDVLTFALQTAGNPIGIADTIQQLSVVSTSVTSPTGFTVDVAASNLELKKTTVDGDELSTIMVDVADNIFGTVDGLYAFRNLGDDFFDLKTVTSQPGFSTAFEVYTNGYDAQATGEKFVGFDGYVAVGEVAGSTIATGAGTVADPFVWTPADANDFFAAIADLFKFTIPFLNKTSLGANDSARRVSIVAALQSAIVSNTDVRSETFQFNVIACPGYPEVVDELLALSVEQLSESLVVADTPPNETPEELTNPTNGWAVSTERQNNTDVCYYYPWCLASNLDGVNVLSAPSGVAIRQMAYNDNVSYLWYAPAGVNRGLTTGVGDVGYAIGVLGGATTFKSVTLNKGQRDALYQDVPSGRINPIVFQPGKGIAIMGQKTSSPKTSALDRINVVRLVMHVRRQLRLTTVNFLFEPNDQRTRDNVKAVADNFLGTILINRGIVDFLTVCDSSNNTADVVDRSELILDVLIKPTKAVEFITIPIRIVSQGAEL